MIPLVDLSSNKKLTAKIKVQVADVINSKSYILGKRLESFEGKFAKYIGASEAIGVGSGTDAIRLSLRAFGVGLGDEVLTVGFTSPFTALAICQEGAVPLFCDVDPNTLTMDVGSIDGKLSKKVKAIMPVHIYGNPCDMTTISAFAKKNGLVIVEDACQAVGAKIGTKMVGVFGDAAAFSFYPTKNLGAYGDGGMVTTNNRTAGAKIKSLRNGGQTKRFWHEYLGINSRLDEIQAAILEEKLGNLDQDNEKRIEIAEKYIVGMADLPIGFQTVAHGAQSSWHLFVLITERREELKAHLLQNGVGSDVYYPYPVYKQRAFNAFPKFKTPVTDRLCEQVLAIPIYPALKSSEQEYIISCVRDFFSKL